MQLESGSIYRYCQTQVIKWLFVRAVQVSGKTMVDGGHGTIRWSLLSIVIRWPVTLPLHQSCIVSNVLCFLEGAERRMKNIDWKWKEFDYVSDFFISILWVSNEFHFYCWIFQFKVNMEISVVIWLFVFWIVSFSTELWFWCKQIKYLEKLLARIYYLIIQWMASVQIEDIPAQLRTLSLWSEYNASIFAFGQSISLKTVFLSLEENSSH